MIFDAPKTTPNKFLRLIFSPNSRLYSKQERHSKAVIVNAECIYKKLIFAILAGAEDHIKIRAESVTRHAFLSSRLKNTNINLVVEALSDSHFRIQRNKGLSKEEIAKKVTAAYWSQEPINLVGLMFTRKNICPLKRGGGDESLTDLAEVISLVHLNSFAALINKFYHWGVKFIILSEGKRYLKTFEYTLNNAIAYQKNLQKLIDLLQLKHLFLYDYEDFLQKKLTPYDLKIRHDKYLKALDIYQKRMLPILDPMNMELTLKKAVLLDPKNDPQNPEKNFVPLWRSILNSLPYFQLQAYAKVKGEEYDHMYLDMIRSLFIPKESEIEESLRKHIIEKSWHAAIEHNACEMGDNEAKIEVDKLISSNAFRTTINPKPGSQLGIYTLRETTSRIQPWHGIGFLETDRSGRLVAIALSKLELESNCAIPIYIDKDNNQPFCYATKDAALILQTSTNFTFNMSTRL